MVLEHIHLILNINKIKYDTKSWDEDAINQRIKLDGV